MINESTFILAFIILCMFIMLRNTAKKAARIEPIKPRNLKPCPNAQPHKRQK